MSSSSRRFSLFSLPKSISGGTAIFLVLLASIALSGFNSGNNLLYLIAGVMLGGIMISFISGRINLAQIEVTRAIPNYAFAGLPFTIKLKISNGKKRMRSLGIYVEGGTGEERPLFLPAVEKKSESTHDLDVVISRRGLRLFPSIMVRSTLPFGLFDLKQTFTDGAGIVVYPRIYDPSAIVGGSSPIRDEFPQHVKGPGSGLYGVREYRHGEDAANISWKLSAKLDRLVVRETEREEKRRVCIVFDNTMRELSADSLEIFERAVSDAASLTWYLCKSGYSVKFVTSNRIIGYDEGSDQMHRILISLALIEPVENERSFLSTKSALEGGTGVLITCRRMRDKARLAKRDFALVISKNLSQ